ncbi:MAG: helix-turn-helix domain-containing protein, partial [Streptosporangiaceae bacterium]
LSICESGLRAAHAPAGPVSRARRWFVVADGKRLRQLRQEHRLSQEMLASRAGISVGTIGQLERQAHPSCRGRTLARLAAALGEQPTTLMPSPH